jgi:hypothetical protein
LHFPTNKNNELARIGEGTLLGCHAVAREM